MQNLQSQFTPAYRYADRPRANSEKIPTLLIVRLTDRPLMADYYHMDHLKSQGRREKRIDTTDRQRRENGATVIGELSRCGLQCLEEYTT
jgi:hypothetical protein